MKEEQENFKVHLLAKKALERVKYIGPKENQGTQGKSCFVFNVVLCCCVLFNDVIMLFNAKCSVEY